MFVPLLQVIVGVVVVVVVAHDFNVVVVYSVNVVVVVVAYGEVIEALRCLRCCSWSHHRCRCC